MIFIKVNFAPELEFTDGTILEVIFQRRLVGLIISYNLSWHNNTQYGKHEMWMVKTGSVGLSSLVNTQYG